MKLRTKSLYFGKNGARLDVFEHVLEILCDNTVAAAVL
jgi:hypothetical protein